MSRRQVYVYRQSVFPYIQCGPCLAGLGLEEEEAGPGGGGGGGGVAGDLSSTMPGCVCPKVKDMGPFSVSRE